VAASPGCRRRHLQSSGQLLTWTCTLEVEDRNSKFEIRDSKFEIRNACVCNSVRVCCMRHTGSSGPRVGLAHLPCCTRCLNPASVSAELDASRVARRSAQVPTAAPGGRYAFDADSATRWARLRAAGLQQAAAVAIHATDAAGAAAGAAAAAAGRPHVAPDAGKAVAAAAATAAATRRSAAEWWLHGSGTLCRAVRQRVGAAVWCRCKACCARFDWVYVTRLRGGCSGLTGRRLRRERALGPQRRPALPASRRTFDGRCIPAGSSGSSIGRGACGS